MNEIEIAKYLETKGSGISSDQISTMREHFIQMSKQAGKEFKEEEFQQIMSISSENIGGTYLYSQDNAIIAIGFGQFVLEGKIDSDIAELVKITIQRELLPILITRFDENVQKERKERLNQMLSDLKKM